MPVLHFLLNRTAISRGHVLHADLTDDASHQCTDHVRQHSLLRWNGDCSNGAEPGIGGVSISPMLLDQALQHTSRLHISYNPRTQSRKKKRLEKTLRPIPRHPPHHHRFSPTYINRVRRGYILSGWMGSRLKGTYFIYICALSIPITSPPS
ncbi:hypothetical protein BDW02DRAFT_650213 [Decorospora gaudefroyi]|uniref:Uncharacterized protein n=1 Tax=Decorospora gaudefroyi TaxID=184978 RepID=A0A6A5K2F7_9PLEO|nr:hypothetical protein BDW02DRAFT_650213 [Decorospora gaudefroyi]